MWLRYVVQVAPEGREAGCIFRSGTNASDLERFVPIGIEDQEADDQGAVFLFLGVHDYRISHLLDPISSHLLTDMNGERFGTDMELSSTPSIATNPELGVAINGSSILVPGHSILPKKPMHEANYFVETSIRV